MEKTLDKLNRYEFIIVVEKLILYPFLFHKNDRLKQFCKTELWNFSTTLLGIY
ncbi:hypothetical protein LEP1GSC103_0026 [Leptospira borgpetersenii serovar Javanica str. UI 09931]|uniref:Uncharacterized protein n=2 Tax=Leptospira borgpetersenii TaxID=174 RepID=A0AAV3JFC3_LEPBO|nr:5'-nucleotidase [Leptospira borgpetersenii serovar Ceylonica]EKQ92443.1 hypothetical protein LEP1GSC101_2424 [Leptospira borgpetersenii str. UI 09149]EMK09279.1 hypothetical protein LEP1GSC066_3031 [Leptospira sp. serovar Kenya str. Sh9]EMN13097.1 hypothetical protein LEP1GSC055_2358 [Leptospira borgpetersenii str. Brem 307]EMN18538.1 hypothetical protein LEP1GSC056_2308 [Leptospira borgpetersenii str. Brem 328]EMN57138.1 hypothetical protein LEP1GSC090_4123 [Leptospira borgpetersenii serov